MFYIIRSCSNGGKQECLDFRVMFLYIPTKKKNVLVHVPICEKREAILIGCTFFFLVGIQEGSIWSFTTQKSDGSCPFTVQANYKGFSEGSKAISNGSRITSTRC